MWNFRNCAPAAIEIQTTHTRAHNCAGVSRSVCCWTIRVRASATTTHKRSGHRRRRRRSRSKIQFGSCNHANICARTKCAQSILISAARVFADVCANCRRNQSSSVLYICDLMITMTMLMMKEHNPTNGAVVPRGHVFNILEVIEPPATASFFGLPSAERPRHYVSRPALT